MWTEIIKKLKQNMKPKKYSYLIMFGNICTDINQGALPAMLPFLIIHHHISYAAAAGLVFATNLVSSIVQPLFGYLGDKKDRRWLMSLGILLAGAGMATIGFLDSYWTMFVAAMTSGVGVALFHPEGGKIANLVAGEKKGSGMGIFTVGGQIGFAVGPIITSAALLAWGMKGTGILIVPVLAMSMITFFSMRNVVAEPEKEHDDKTRELADDWKSFGKTAVLVSLRSIIYLGLTTFIPLYWVGVLRQSTASGSITLTIYSGAAAVATLAGGYLADRFGFFRIINICAFSLVPLLFIFTQTRQVTIALVLVIFIGMTLNGSHSTLIAMGQSFLPNRIGLASGIMLGLTVSMGGVVAPGIGLIGDQFGLPATMYTIMGFAVLALLFTFVLPKKKNVSASKRKLGTRIVLSKK